MSDFSAAAERNKGPILERLAILLRDARRVLEIGSGTGQHATFFAAQMPWLQWTCTELPERVPALAQRIAQAQCANLSSPVPLDVLGTWPNISVDAIFSANTLHIMPWTAVEAFFSALPDRLPVNARVVIYGPFHYAGHPTSDSNAAFDQMLRADDVRKGIRDIEAVLALSQSAGLRLLGDFAMPANNRLLAWEKTA